METKKMESLLEVTYLIIINTYFFKVFNFLVNS
jgi:hypothetical protein